MPISFSRTLPIAIAVLGFAALSAQAPPIPQAPPGVDYSFNPDTNNWHYSVESDINIANVNQLKIAWEWSPGEQPRPEFGTQPGNFQNTPIMAGNVLYTSTMYNRVVALDAQTGKEIWSYDPKAYEDGQPPNGTGFVHRGIALWGLHPDRRILLASRWRLIALDALTGKPIPSFGDNGIVDLTKGLRREVNRRHYTNTSPPIIYRDLVIVGNGVGDRLTYKGDPPGDVRAFDVMTGRQIWRFNTVPEPGEFGNDTWGNESWKTMGHTNVWAPMSLDSTRGLLYLPVSTPSNDFYGGERPGANLFGDSLVCLDAATGARKWHFQVLHHGLWDYDMPSAPALAFRSVNGKNVDVVVALTKQGFAFVLDRVTGNPVWPIEERSVPPSDVEGERAWPTQPFPTKPAAYARQGMTLDDAIDFTPDLKAQAQAEMKKYRLGPLYTPPSVQGTLMNPGIIGGANWGGSAFDIGTRILYVKTSHQPALVRIRPGSEANSRPGESDAPLAGSVGNASFTPTPPAGFAGSGRMGSLPLVKPPYGELVAISLDSGEILWRVPFGDTPSVRQHPLLKDVKLPARLGAAGAPGVLVTRSGLVLGGGGDSALYAFNKQTGQELARFELPRRASATPMTYSVNGRQFVVMATGGGANASLVAWTVK